MMRTTQTLLFLAGVLAMTGGVFWLASQGGDDKSPDLPETPAIVESNAPEPVNLPAKKMESAEVAAQAPELQPEAEPQMGPVADKEIQRTQVAAEQSAQSQEERKAAWQEEAQAVQEKMLAALRSGDAEAMAAARSAAEELARRFNK